MHVLTDLFTLMESPQSIDLKNESNRLGTFTGWPVSFIITPKSLAAAGFYYTKHTDKVIIIYNMIYNYIITNK